jgi:uncharacterized protein YcsI (UPF0317 family)
MSAAQAQRAREVTRAHPLAHGAPVHVGDPSTIGVNDLSRPDFGDPVEIRKGEVPVFWACGVTAQVVIEAAKVPLAITHAPGHMFVTDLKDDELAAHGHG